MSVGQIVTERLFGKLVVAWLFALLLAVIGATVTSYSVSQLAVVIGMLGTISSFVLQHHEVSNGESESGEKERSEVASDSSDEDGSDQSSADVADVSATEGLSPTERRVQNELIREAYCQFSERPFAFWPSPQGESLRNHLSEEFDEVDDDVIDKVWRFSKDDGFFKRRPGKRTLAFTPKAVWRAEALGEETLLDETVQDEILDILLQAYRSDPARPRIDRDELIEAVGRPSDIVDHNLWLLREKDYVETQAYLNTGEAGYSEVEITQLGRKVSQ